MKIIVIGGGAAGLMAAKHLSAAGHELLVLEARDRLGGRINTFRGPGEMMVEGGAEFIHGNLGVTLDLLKEAGITYTEVAGEFWEYFGGEWSQPENIFDHADLLEKKLKKLNENISIKEFLDLEFGGEEYGMMRLSVLSYVEGYYAADPARLSALQFYKEWHSEDEQQYRVDGGYGRMIECLAACIKSNGGDVQLSTVIRKINLLNQPFVTDESGREFYADKIILAIPLGVWQSDQEPIVFEPALPAKYEAAKQLGFGGVIKMLLYFKEAFWKGKVRIDEDVSDISFIISGETIPTYWTQLPADNNLLTAWVAGPDVKQYALVTDEVLVQEALTSLSKIFNISVAELQNNLEWSQVFNWQNDPFACGGYTYTTTEAHVAREVLAAPVENVLFFAGEALYEGVETGTVEAALTSGLRAAQQVISSIGT
jgi:monoamine oxidase